MPLSAAQQILRLMMCLQNVFWATFASESFKIAVCCWTLMDWDQRWKVHKQNTQKQWSKFKFVCSQISESAFYLNRIAENFFVTSQISPLIPVRVWLIDWLQVPRAQISISGVFISIFFSIPHSLHAKENESKTRNDDQQIFSNNKV